MRTLLVTGGAGFIGSCFIRTQIENYNIINLDALTYAGNLENLKDVKNHPHYRFIKGDVCDRDLLNRIYKENEIEMVVNFAAESHVDRSIKEPEIFLRTNILGTQALLDAAKKHWSICPEDKFCMEYKSGVKFVQVSTDEVYGTLGDTGLFNENTPLTPNNPYSVSKASADMLALAYHHTYKIPLNVTRCSNNYGPYQFPEKLIPLMIHNCIHNKLLPVYGDGLQIRDWIYVEDHCKAIAAVLERGNPGEVYNIGGNCERTNIELIRILLQVLGKPESLISYIKDRQGHDRRYAIDNTKIKSELRWEPQCTFETGIKSTVDWYLDNWDWMIRVTSGEYLSYYKLMYVV